MTQKMRQRKRRSLRVSQGPFCAHCGVLEECAPFGYLTLDHIIPVSRGGPDALWNLQLLCRICNGKKGNRVDVECFFFQVAA